MFSQARGHRLFSEFRRMHTEAITAAGAALIRFARSCGLIRGEWIAVRIVNNQGDGTLFDRNDFRYEPDSDTYICPGDKRLLRKHTNHKDPTSETWFSPPFV